MTRPGLPDLEQTRRSPIGIVIAVMFVFGAGVVGYSIGGSSGSDLSAAGSADTAAEQRKAATETTSDEYTQSFDAAREQGFADAYAAAYESAYLKKFKKAGLDAPKNVSVPEAGATQEGAG